jgi:hypothetical protein
LLRLSELSKVRDRSIGISKAVRELHPYNFRGWPKLKLTSHYDHFDYLVVMRKHRALKTRERKWLRDNVVTWAPYFALRELDMSPRDAEWVRRQVDNIPPTFIIVGDPAGSPEDVNHDRTRFTSR